VQQNAPECQNTKMDGDSDVDQDDMSIFLRCLSGPTVAAPYDCEGT